MTDLPERKKAWRRAARELFALMPRGERADPDAALCARLREHVTGDGILLAYAALPDEADVTAFLRERLAAGGRVALPAWTGGRTLTLREIRDWDADLTPGRGGIAEPRAVCPEAPPEAVGQVLVPGRFFSERCERLGRGAGCYDALLARRDVRTLGVAYDFQIVPSLPTDGNDVPVDAVVTPTRTVGKWNRSE